MFFSANPKQLHKYRVRKATPRNALTSNLFWLKNLGLHLPKFKSHTIYSKQITFSNVYQKNF